MKYHMGFGSHKSDKILNIGRRVRNREKKHALSNPYVYAFIERFKQEILELKKPSTYDGWSKIYQEMAEEFGHLKFDKLDKQVIQLYFTKLSKRVMPSSVQRHWTALSAVLKYAVKQSVIESFERPELPRKTRSQQQWLDLEQMKKLLTHSFGRLHLLVMILCETGCRKGEALGLKTSDVDFINKTLSIKRTIFKGIPNSPKTDSSNRTLAISDELCDTFKSLVPKKDGYIFHTKYAEPWSYGWAEKQMWGLCDKAGIPRVGFHAFRRGNITHLVRDLEIPETIVGQRVGHLSEGMTLGVYVQRSSGLDKKYIGMIAESLYGKLNNEQ